MDISAHEIRFGIVGAGTIARYHAQAIADTPGARLVALCETNVQYARESESAFGVPCETSFEAFLARADIDVVNLCTPSGLHAAQAVAAARAGKHVLVEKPMALSLEDADAMIAACRAADVRLGVMLQRRAEPAIRAIHAAIESGELGDRVLGAVSLPYYRPQSYYDSSAWRGTWAMDGGGALMNQGIHLLDLLVWLMGDVVEVTARAATLAHTIEVEDCLAATLRFANGALGSLIATTAAAPGFPARIEVYGTLGGAQVDGESVTRWEMRDAPGPVASAGVAPVSAGAGASPTGISAEGHTRLMRDMVAAIADRRPPLVPGEEGRRALAVTLAIYESARTGRPVKPA